MVIELVSTLVTITFWGSYLVPAKKSDLPPSSQTVYLTFGNLLFSIVAFMVFKPSLNSLTLIYSFMAGLIWSIGGISAFIGIRYLGLVRGPGIWGPGKIVMSMFLGVVFFGEIVGRGEGNLALGLLATALLAIGILMMILTKETTEAVGEWHKGLLLAVVVAVFWSSYLVPIKLSPGPEYSKVLPMALGMFLPSVSVGLSKGLRHQLTDTLTMCLSGVMWGIANYTSLIMFELLGISRGFALSQLALVVNTLWGILVFHEVKGRRRLLMVTLGVVISVLGGAIMSVTRT